MLSLSGVWELGSAGDSRLLRVRTRQGWISLGAAREAESQGQFEGSVQAVFGLPGRFSGMTFGKRKSRTAALLPVFA